MTNLKLCCVCNTKKPFDEFYKRENSPDGVRNNCKSCHKARSSRNYRLDINFSREKSRNYHHKRVAKNPYFYKEHYAKNKDYLSGKGSETYQRHKERIKARVQKWAEENRGKSNAIKKGYKAAKSRACPPWARSDKALRTQMDEIYELAYKISTETGVKHHVDHIIPLRGKTVSGLHVPWNLQVLPGSENCRKSNRLLEEV